MRALVETPELSETLLHEVDGPSRVVIEGVQPEIDGGQFPIKRVVGENVVVEADVFADGHQSISCEVLYRADTDREWRANSMHPLQNDRWRADFQVTKLGKYLYSIQGWIDPFKTWRDDLAKRYEARQDLTVDLLIGADLLEDAARRTSGQDSAQFADWARVLRQGSAQDAATSSPRSEDA